MARGLQPQGTQGLAATWQEGDDLLPQPSTSSKGPAGHQSNRGPLRLVLEKSGRTQKAGEQLDAACSWRKLPATPGTCAEALPWTRRAVWAILPRVPVWGNRHHQWARGCME